jgi:hypothetical protein
MLDRRFSAAPLMDWTNWAEKANHNHNLSMVAISDAVPNAVPMLLESSASEWFRVPTFVWRPPRIAAYYTNLRDCTPSNERATSCLFYRGGGGSEHRARRCHPFAAWFSRTWKARRFSTAFVSTKMLEANLRPELNSQNAQLWSQFATGKQISKGYQVSNDRSWRIVLKKSAA